MRADGLFFATGKKSRSKANFAPTWRRGWDSNPCDVAVKLISSQPRYDRFDTSPYMLIRFSEVNAYSIFIIVRPAFERLTPSAVRSLILYMITKECQHIFCPDKPAVKEPERFKRRGSRN